MITIRDFLPHYKISASNNEEHFYARQCWLLLTRIHLVKGLLQGILRSLAPLRNISPCMSTLKLGRVVHIWKSTIWEQMFKCQMSPSFAVPQSKCYVCSRMVIFLPLENGYSRMVSCSENHHDGSPLVSEGPGVLGHVNIAWLAWTGFIAIQNWGYRTNMDHTNSFYVLCKTSLWCLGGSVLCT